MVDAAPTTSSADAREGDEMNGAGRTMNVSKMALEEALAALRASEERYRLLIRASAQVIITTDASGANTDSGSDWWEQITGQSLGESRNHGWTKRLHPDDYAATVALWQRSLAAQTPFETEFRVQRRSGDYCWMQATGAPTHNPDGSFREWIIALRDISERKQAEAALRRNEERARAQAEELEALMRAVPAAVWIAHDTECRRITGSQFAHELLRMPLGANLSKTAPAGEEPTHFKVLKDGVELLPEELPVQLAARGVEVHGFEEEVVFDDGLRRSLYGNAVPLRDSQGQVRGAISAFVDITERKQAELALRESEERFAKAFQSSPHLMTISTLEEGRYLAVNDAVLRATGYTREEMIGQTSAALNIFAHLEGRGRLVREFAEHGSVRDLELKLRGKDGRLQTLLVSGEIINVRGQRCILTTSVDVTGHRQAEADTRLLAELSERIRLAAEAEALLWETAQMVGEYLQARRCFFAEVDLTHDRGLIRRDYCRGVPSVAGEYRFSDYSPVTRGELLAGHTLVNCDAQNDPRTAALYEAVYQQAGERAYIGVPLLRENRLVGIFCVSTDEPRAWQPRETALLETVAERVWLAVEKLRLNQAVRESEARLKLAQESGGIGAWDWDAATGVTYWSDMTWQIYGEQPDPTRSATGFWETRLHPADRARVLAGVIRFLSSTECDYRDEFRIVRRDGAVRWIESVGRLKRDSAGASLYLSGVNIDITERKQAEEERERLLVQAQEARAVAEAATRAKDEFIALVSHELRSPLNAILGWNHMLRAQRGADPEIARITETIERAGRAQLQLVEDLLDTARVISGKLRLNVGPVELNRVVEAALDTLRPAAEARGIMLISLPDPSPVAITGDPDRLQQVVWNLVSNALKFTPAGGRVTVEVRRRPEGVEIIVTDTGRGISAELLPQLFERLRQGDPDASQRAGGLGLGLALVKYLVELHGGNVCVESPGEGQGATFTITLPLQAAEQAEPPAPERLCALQANAAVPEGAHNLAGLRILVADDEDTARELLVFALGQYGAAVTAVDSAAAVLGALAAPDAHFDVLVTDIGMPEINGHELLRQVRKLPDKRLRRLPAVALTAYARTEDRLNALAAGFQMHVAKPVELEELTTVIASLTGRLESK